MYGFVYCRKNPDLASYGGASSETASQPPPIPLNGGGQVISAYNPYDTTSLHIFIREAFSGAILMEEHQVMGQRERESVHHLIQ